MTPVIALPACTATPDPPELPALSALLNGATRMPDAEDWRSGVLSGLGITAAGQAGRAMVAARAVTDMPPGTGICLALPVHVVAGASRVFLAAAGAFALEAQEREQLRVSFNAEFGAADVRLHAAGSGWVLQAPFATAASDASPESLLGTALAREPAASAAGRALRRLGAEAEMWLAAHDINAAREKRGEPPINCIWFWGGSTSGNLPVPHTLPGAVFTNTEPDPWLAGLGAHCGLAIGQAHGWEAARNPEDALVVLQPALPGEVLRELAAWESAWLEPARRDLAAGRMASLRLHIGRSTWQLPAPRLSRLLRRRRPWWQMVPA